MISSAVAPAAFIILLFPMIFPAADTCASAGCDDT
jgi:hypothetical protein